MGEPPYRRDFPPRLGSDSAFDPHPTRHEQRLSAIATVRRRDRLAYEVAWRRDFLGLSRRRVATLLKVSYQTLARRRVRFWLALQEHLCAPNCEDCDQPCRRP